jgi:UDP-glucose 4-epimerase
MNILVTGGAGFIGSHLVKALLNKGHKVVVLDNLSTGQITRVAEASFIYGDVCKLSKATPHLRKHEPFDAVYHLAGMLDVKQSFIDSVFYTDVNIRGTQNVLEYCVDRKIPKFIYASSCASGTPLESPYALTKYVPELYCQMYNKHYDIDTLNVRFFNVYGDGMNTSGYRLVLEIFLDAFSKGDPLPIVGSGDQTRDFICVDDIVEGLVMALDTKNNGAVIELGSGKSTSINDVVRCFGNNTQTISLPPRKEPKHVQTANIQNTQKILEQWQPKIELSSWIQERIKD